MLRRKNELGFNIICWLLGHDVGGKPVAKSYRTVRGEMVDGWHYYCKRCQNPNDYPLNQFPDRRNLYQRTIRVWIHQLQNRWRFRNFNKDWERDKKNYLLYLDEQLKKYKS